MGAGGYGFVMTARHRTEGHEVAVKFIIKDKVPEHAWWDDEVYGRVPTEVMLLSLVNHENIVKCLDLFEDDVYFYLVGDLRVCHIRERTDSGHIRSRSFTVPRGCPGSKRRERPHLLMGSSSCRRRKHPS